MAANWLRSPAPDSRRDGGLSSAAGKPNLRMASGGNNELSGLDVPRDGYGDTL